jgi:hypothetical protein
MVLGRFENNQYIFYVINHSSFLFHLTKNIWNICAKNSRYQFGNKQKVVQLKYIFIDIQSINSEIKIAQSKWYAERINRLKIGNFSSLVFEIKKEFSRFSDIKNYSFWHDRWLAIQVKFRMQHMIVQLFREPETWEILFKIQFVLHATMEILF